MIDIETKSLDGDLPLHVMTWLACVLMFVKERNCFGDGFACAVDVEDYDIKMGEGKTKAYINSEGVGL